MSRSVVARAVGLLRSVFPPDPGGIRFHDAACATLSGLLAFVVARLLGLVVPLPANIEVFGFAAAVFAAVAAHDEGEVPQIVTTVLTAVPMALLLLVTSISVVHPALLDAMLVGLIALAVYAPAVSPRLASLASVAVMAELFGVVTRPPLSEIEERLLILAIAVASALYVRFRLMRQTQADIARRVAAGVANTIVATLVPVAEAVRQGEATPALAAAATDSLARLEEAVTYAQAKLGPSAQTRPVADHLLDLEFATERVVETALHAMPSAAADRQAALENLAAVRVGLVSGRPPRGKEAKYSPVHLLNQIAFLARAVSRPIGKPVPLPPKDPAVVATLRRTALVQAIQAAVAVAVAIAVGHAISSMRWYWAAFTTFLVFQGVRSRQESMFKAWQIAVGTVGGVVVGVLVATALSGHPYVEIPLAVVALFLAFYASTAAYGVMIFWVTIILGLVFGMLGFFPPELLTLRLEETLLGVVCGLGGAFLLRLDRGGDTLDAAERQARASLKALVVSASAGLAGQGDAAAVAADEAAAQRSFIAYASLALPRLRGMPTMWGTDLRRRLAALRAASHFGQDLAELAAGGRVECDAPTAKALADEAARLEALIEAPPRDRPRPVKGQAPPRFVPTGAGQRGHEAFRLLLAIEDALARA